MSGGILPTFVTPADVEALKRMIDPSVRALDVAVFECPGLAESTRIGWAELSKAWRSFCAEEASWLHTKAQYDRAESYRDQIAAWQRLIASRCGGAKAPEVSPPPERSTVHETLGAIRMVAIAGIAIAVASGLSSVGRR